MFIKSDLAVKLCSGNSLPFHIPNVLICPSMPLHGKAISRNSSVVIYFPFRVLLQVRRYRSVYTAD